MRSCLMRADIVIGTLGSLSYEGVGRAELSGISALSGPRPAKWSSGRTESLVSLCENNQKIKVCPSTLWSKA